MKKIILSFLLLTVFTFCFIVCVSAQSSGTDLDQVELMKQFIGKWKTEAGKDSIWLWEIMPSNKGYVHTFYLQVKGTNVETVPGIIGFADDYKNTSLLILYQDGFISRDFGGFVSDSKYIAERFYPQEKKTGLGFWECTFVTPDKFTAIWKVKGVKRLELIYTRVKD